jgi:acyl-CoA thioesterase I
MNRAVNAAILLVIGVVVLAMSPLKAPRLLILGDSLTEGYGVEPEDAYPVLLDSMLRAHFPEAKVIGGGVSGSTSASGIRRLKWYAQLNPNWVLIALGSNDGLRGVPIEETKRQLDTTIRFCQSRGWRVILAGLKVPPNYGAEYASAFTQVYSDLAGKYQLPYFPFLLEGVAGEARFNQGDGIHPNVAGHQLIARNLYQFLSKLPGFLTNSSKTAH